MNLRLATMLFILVAVVSGQGYLDDLKDMWNTMVDFAGEGIKTVIRAERFVDSAIGEECIYECPSRHQHPVPKEDHVKTANGCGSFSVIFDDSEESYLHVENAFTECCNEHDYCYDTCNSDKDMCDLTFKRCLYRNCRNLPFLETKTCKLKAKVFYLTVIGVGCQSYINSQDNACECVRRGKSEL